jgi:hypothetical protein
MVQSTEATSHLTLETTVETVSVTIELPVVAPLRLVVRALEYARDAQTDTSAKQALAAVAALASRGLMETLASATKNGGRDESQAARRPVD